MWKGRWEEDTERARGSEIQREGCNELDASGLRRKDRKQSGRHFIEFIVLRKRYLLGRFVFGRLYQRECLQAFCCQSYL